MTQYNVTCDCGRTTCSVSTGNASISWVRMQCANCLKRPLLYRVTDRLDEWQHAHLPYRLGLAWYKFWRPLCDWRESKLMGDS